MRATPTTMTLAALLIAGSAQARDIVCHRAIEGETLWTMALAIQDRNGDLFLTRDGSRASPDQHYEGSIETSKTGVIFSGSNASGRTKRAVIIEKAQLAIVDSGLHRKEQSSDGAYRCEREPAITASPAETQVPPPTATVETTYAELIPDTARARYCAQVTPGAAVRWPEVASDGSLVRDLQAALATMAIDPGPIDGNMGPRTWSALIAWRDTRSVYPEQVIRQDALCTLLNTKYEDGDEQGTGP